MILKYPFPALFSFPYTVYLRLLGSSYSNIQNLLLRVTSHIPRRKKQSSQARKTCVSICAKKMRKREAPEIPNTWERQPKRLPSPSDIFWRAKVRTKSASFFRSPLPSSSSHRVLVLRSSAKFSSQGNGTWHEENNYNIVRLISFVLFSNASVSHT